MKIIQKILELKSNQTIPILREELSNSWSIQWLFIDPTDRSSFVVLYKYVEEGIAGDPDMLQTPKDIDEDEAEPVIKPRETAPWITQTKKRKK